MDPRQCPVVHQKTDAHLGYALNHAGSWLHSMGI